MGLARTWPADTSPIVGSSIAGPWWWRSFWRSARAACWSCGPIPSRPTAISGWALRCCSWPASSSMVPRARCGRFAPTWSARANSGTAVGVMDALAYGGAAAQGPISAGTIVGRQSGYGYGGMFWCWHGHRRGSAIGHLSARLRTGPARASARRTLSVRHDQGDIKSDGVQGPGRAARGCASFRGRRSRPASCSSK